MKVEIYGRIGCHFCEKAIDRCHASGIEFTYIDIGKNPEAKEKLLQLVPNATKVPQIFDISEEGSMVHIGGYADFVVHLNNR